MIKVEIVADSVRDQQRLTTFQITYPRYILPEVLTHCALARNTASSRAIPVQKRIDAVQSNMAEPVWYGLNKPGMAATDCLAPEDLFAARQAWDSAGRAAAEHTAELLRLNVHKQVANRLLEPFSHITQVVTGSHFGWQNFFAQRVSEHADPTFDCLAGQMLEAYLDNRPVDSVYHLPYVHIPSIREEVKTWTLSKVAEVDKAFDSVLQNPGTFQPFKRHAGDTDPWFVVQVVIKVAYLVSTARCARVSYETQERDHTIESDVDLALNKVIKLGHMSPTEHSAFFEWSSGVSKYSPTSWTEFRKYLRNENKRMPEDDMRQALEQWRGRQRGRGVVL